MNWRCLAATIHGNANAWPASWASAIRFIAGAIGADPTVFVTTDGTRLPIEPGYSILAGTKATYGLRPEHLLLSDAASGVPATISVVEPTGSETQVLFSFAGQQLNGVFRERIADRPGDVLFLRPDVTKVCLFDAATGLRIIKMG